MLGFLLLLAASAADPASLPAAGPAATCLIVGRQLDYRVAAPDVLLVRAGGRWHRSRLPDGCPALQPNRIVVRREASPRACANDLFEVRDNFRPDEFGLCRFGPFEPLARPPAKSGRADLAGLSPSGPVVACLEETGLQLVVTASRDWLLLRQGRQAFRAELAGGCPGLGQGRILARANTQGRLCRNDLLGVIDPVGGMNYGQCRIGRIEPVAIPRGARF